MQVMASDMFQCLGSRISTHDGMHRVKLLLMSYIVKKAQGKADENVNPVLMMCSKGFHGGDHGYAVIQRSDMIFTSSAPVFCKKAPSEDLGLVWERPPPEEAQIFDCGTVRMGVYGSWGISIDEHSNQGLVLKEKGAGMMYYQTLSVVNQARARERYMTWTKTLSSCAQSHLVRQAMGQSSMAYLQETQEGSVNQAPTASSTMPSEHF